MSAPTGNRCGHDPRQPKLSPAHPIRKGKGGLPRILSLAAERAKAWYFHPKKCPLLSHPNRQTRSERREACQIVLETILSHAWAFLRPPAASPTSTCAPSCGIPA